MKSPLTILFLLLLATAASFSASPLRASTEQDVKIGDYFVSAPYGIAIIVDDATAFVIDPVCDQLQIRVLAHQRPQAAGDDVLELGYDDGYGGARHDPAGVREHANHIGTRPQG